MSEEQPSPVGGPILTKSFAWLIGLLAVGLAVMAWRFAAGLGATTGLSHGYPWGIWIALEVVTGTALACGGYAVAILCYVLNKGEYHPLVRPAILTSALGYTMAALAIIIDVGRYWNIFKIPIRADQWNLTSVLLEVALCVMAYVVVLWIELSPAFLEKWKERSEGALKTIADKTYPVLNRLMVVIIALGLLLPTMHQSSLGSVMLISGPKLHRLWFTPMLPLLFLISCVGMGYAMVVFESSIAVRVFKRKAETTMLGRLSGAMIPALALYVVLRLGDIIFRGQLGAAFAFDLYSFLFWIEIALFVVPILMLTTRERRMRPRVQFDAAIFMILGGALYRFNTYLVAFDPGPGWSYFPTLWEVLVSAGIVALEIMAYVYIVKRYPILAGRSSAAARA
jgi:Ni/Fe-hydrogenase subunit HybB-like protein